MILTKAVSAGDDLGEGGLPPVMIWEKAVI